MFGSQGAAEANAAARSAITKDALRTKGEYLYTDLEKATKQEATEALKAQGIPGIKYLDGASRSAGKGSRNYVVFDDNIISILNKYVLAGLVTGGGIGALLNAQKGSEQ